MKTSKLIGSGIMGMMLASATALAGQAHAQKSSAAAHPVRHVIYVEVTGSRIPQRVVVGGNTVNSASPVTVFQGRGIADTGATSVVGVLALDPDITIRGATGR